METLGPEASRFALGERVGVAWIYSACGRCRFCRAGLENLCPDFLATGRDVNGGYAEYMVVPEAFAIPHSPRSSPTVRLHPSSVPGAIGYRSLSLANPFDGQKLGLTGFRCFRPTWC